MTCYTPVPSALWREVRGYFAALVAPCKTCLRGNPTQCWYPECPAFRVRDLAYRVASTGVTEDTPSAARQARIIEDEIIDILKHFDKPVYPSMIILTSTNSKANKSHAIDRLVKQGRIVEERINSYTRTISLPTTTKEN